MALLTKDAIFRISDVVTEDVEVPEWGGTVRVKALNGMERDQFESANIEHQKNGKVKVNMSNARARLAVMVCVDDTGALIFSESDIGMLSTKSAAALDRVFEVATRLAGIGEKDMDELTGN